MPLKKTRPRKGPGIFKAEEGCPEGYDPIRFRTLTLTERKFVRAYFTNGFKQKEAALGAGLKDGPGIDTQAWRMLKNVESGLNWEDIFEARGINDSKLADVIEGALEAESAVVTEESTYNDKGRIASKTQKITYVVDASAHRTRLEGVKVIGKWKGREKVQIGGDGMRPIPVEIRTPNGARAIAEFKKKAARR